MKRLALVLPVLAVATMAVVRTGKGSDPPGSLVVSGGDPPEPPAIGSTPVAGSGRPGREPARDWGAAGQYGDWAYAMGSRVPIAPRTLAAYALGERHANAHHPSCGLSWVTLAAIGSIESGHGHFGGSAISADGLTTSPITGPALDGSPGVRAIVDTDNGSLDGDTEWDRAVGPMQFLPTTWRRWSVDADTDGTANPHDLDDAAATAATYLCESTASMTTGQGWWTAVLAYNHSTQYARNVLALSNDYAHSSQG